MLPASLAVVLISPSFPECQPGEPGPKRCRSFPDCHPRYFAGFLDLFPRFWFLHPSLWWGQRNKGFSFGPRRHPRTAAQLTGLLLFFKSVRLSKSFENAMLIIGGLTLQSLTFKSGQTLTEIGSGGGTRTHDPRIKSALLTTN